MSRNKKNKKHLVAVYGSLLKGLHNHKYYLSDAEFIGSFDSDPNYTLYSVGSYPGLVENGYTSVKMEVYEVNTLDLNAIDRLEGFKPKSNNNHYNRVEMDTPYGKAYGYIYQPSTKNLPVVINGDWKDYYNSKTLINV